MVIERNQGRIRRGDVYVLNDPYHGGTHLPDVTVVTPVFAPERDDIWFYVASRGHHAEIGGISPGSMPAASTRVEEEGVLIDNWLLVQNARLREAETMNLLATAEYPSRDPATNVADLRAQIAANERGIAELRAMVEHFGLDVVHAYMGHVQENAAESVRRVITALHDGQYEYELDNGAKVKVAVRVNAAGPDRRGRLHRHVRAAGRQLQRAVQRGHGGRAVRVPHPGRRRHPAQLRLPAPADGDHPARDHAVAAVPGGGRGGQRGDFPGRHRRAVRGARGDGRGIRDNEQRDVRERALPVLRDRGQRLRRRRRLRRHRCGADQDDQLPAHRPRGAGVAVPGAAGVLPDHPRQRRRGPLARRERRHPAAALQRADDRHHPGRAPPHPRVRHGGRPAGRPGPPLGRAP